MFEIQRALLRSRIRRVHNIIDEVAESIRLFELGEAKEKSLKIGEVKKKFESENKNKFIEEFP